MSSTSIEIRAALQSWYRAFKRSLPWRATRDPYPIWISETMLQQTQAGRVMSYFKAWMDLFPNIRSLASASEDRVLKAWEGLGYYSRAKNLRRAAGIVVFELGGIFPDTVEDLRHLPGVGPYTASAVASIAFGRPVAVVDANVRRVLSRMFDLDMDMASRDGRKTIESLAEGLLDPDAPGDFNQAIMELGALICRPKSPNCDRCPVDAYCRALTARTVPLRPVKTPEREKIHISMATGILFHENRIFIQKRCDDDVWGGLWEFPGGVVEPEEEPADSVVREYLEETGFCVEVTGYLTMTRHVYTRHRVTLECFACRFTENEDMKPILTAAQEYAWVRPSELERYAFPAGHRKLLAWMTAHKVWDRLP
ncbi:MAG: A/G-specific adenine glycosylase [Deltaproteobacteria bacterium]|nr:A/G-specific adenine glycosylase [Deltaproteobacteria bacterium]